MLHDILRGLENPTFYLLSDTNLLNGCDRGINCAVSCVLQQPGENYMCATEIKVFQNIDGHNMQHFRSYLCRTL